MITTHVLPRLGPHAIGAGHAESVQPAGSWRSSSRRLHGHDLLIHFENDRLCLKCATCGFETTGWRIKRRYALDAPSEVGCTGGAS